MVSTVDRGLETTPPIPYIPILSMAYYYYLHGRISSRPAQIWRRFNRLVKTKSSHLRSRLLPVAAGSLHLFLQPASGASPQHLGTERAERRIKSRRCIRDNYVQNCYQCFTLLCSYSKLPVILCV